MLGLKNNLHLADASVCRYVSKDLFGIGVLGMVYLKTMNKQEKIKGEDAALDFFTWYFQKTGNHLRLMRSFSENDVRSRAKQLAEIEKIEGKTFKEIYKVYVNE